TYLVHGAGLMLFKYGADAAVVWAFTHRLWTPLTYLNPPWVLREQLLRDAPAWLAPALVLWTLPFLWVGVSMTLRRAVDAGRSPWWCLLFFVPCVNYAGMLWLALLPSRAHRGAPALLALPGAILGRAVALRSVGPPARAGFAALLAPLVVLASPRQAAPSHEVVTAVVIDAPPAVVWRHVVTFPELPPPREWLFRAG